MQTERPRPNALIDDTTLLVLPNLPIPILTQLKTLASAEKNLIISSFFYPLHSCNLYSLSQSLFLPSFLSVDETCDIAPANSSQTLNRLVPFSLLLPLIYLLNHRILN